MIQIDIPMPTNCLDCPACNEYLTCAIPVNGRKWGENDVHDFSQSRPEWCPLKEQEAKTGHWVFESQCYEAWTHTCSECGKRMTTAVNTFANWCWNCGAKMETGGEVE